MRQKVCEALVNRANSNPDMVLLTGDLGFMALEPLRDVMGERFINCGVAEQNMISVAAAMAKEKLDVWTYTIAPFCYARAFEQIRNDVFAHRLPVKMLGNGGGFGYGVMGSTHHAIEDYGVLLTLSGLKVYTPASFADIQHAIDRAGANKEPSYLRLGRDEIPVPLTLPEYAPWRRLLCGDGPVVITLGPIAGSLYKVLSGLQSSRPKLWIVSELPPPEMPSELVDAIARSERLCIVEEHAQHGGLASILCISLLAKGIRVKAFRHLYARYTTSLSGSQDYLRRQCGIDPQGVVATLRQLTES